MGDEGIDDFCFTIECNMANGNHPQLETILLDFRLLSKVWNSVISVRVLWCCHLSWAMCHAHCLMHCWPV